MDRLTDAEIEAAVAADPDAAPILTEEWFRQATWMPPLTKKGVFLRLDPQVVAWFRAGGPGYQTRMNAVLRAYAIAHRKPAAKKKRAARKPWGGPPRPPSAWRCRILASSGGRTG